MPGTTNFHYMSSDLLFFLFSRDDQTSEHLVGEILFFILLAIVFSIGAALWTVAGAWSSIKAARREKLEEKELLAAA